MYRVRKTGISILIPIATAVRIGDDEKGSLSLAVKDSVDTAKGERSSYDPLRASRLNMTATLGNKAKKRFFIMKRPATEDLEVSVQNGHWLTQEHNETTLNEAFVVWLYRLIAIDRHLT